MKTPESTNWSTSIAEAKAIQNTLANKVVTDKQFDDISLVAGTDVGFEQSGTITRAAVVVLRFPELIPVEYHLVREPTCFPYVPGYLSFRECPALLTAINSLDNRPDLILCDGQGIAHPRRFGIASHIGVMTGIATIGVAKSRLIGHYVEPARDKGAWTYLMDGDEIIGAALRNRRNVKPLFVSIGHKIDLESAVDLVQRCSTRYRLPETTRLADRLASRRGAMPPLDK